MAPVRSRVAKAGINSHFLRMVTSFDLLRARYRTLRLGLNCGFIASERVP